MRECTEINGLVLALFSGVASIDIPIHEAREQPKRIYNNIISGTAATCQKPKRPHVKFYTL